MNKDIIMKLHHKIITGTVALAVCSISFTACTDEIKFGEAFIEKAPGGTVTLDTVFNSAEYTKQFLVGLYVQQYYGLPYKNPTGSPWSQSYWNSKLDALTDCYHQHFSGSQAYTKYYSNALTANDNAMIAYNDDKVWETVHHCWLLIEHIDAVPGLTDAEKKSMVAQAKCIMATSTTSLSMADYPSLNTPTLEPKQISRPVELQPKTPSTSW